MRCLIQRVKNGQVDVNNQTVGSIKKGLLVYIGFCDSDTKEKADYIMDRIAKIRVFEDDEGRLNRSLKDEGANALIIPNFSLYADATTGRRPSFTKAMRFSDASALFEYACDVFDSIYGEKSERGVFGADMKISSIADGPINIYIEQ